MGKIVPLPESIIRQHEIESLIALDNQILRLTRQRDVLAEDIMARHLAGERVEPGIYDIEIKELPFRGGRRLRLIVR